MDAGLLAAPALEAQGQAHEVAGHAAVGDRHERAQELVRTPAFPSWQPLRGRGPGPSPLQPRWVAPMPNDQESLDLFRVYLDQIGRHPLLTDEELAAELDMATEKVHRLKDTAQAITSLDTPIGDDGAALQDFLEDDSAVGPDELAVEAVGRDALADLRRPEIRTRLHGFNGAA